MAKPGRSLDKRQTNRRQKHELDARVRKYRMTPKLGVVLLDWLADKLELPASTVMVVARKELRRANREARRRG